MDAKYNPDTHHRKSVRLKHYDYSQAGAYFITICTHNRECLFGEIIDGKMALNDAGQMVQAVWDEIPGNYDGVETDVFVIMPNHVHGIVVIVGAGPCACPNYGQPQHGQPRGVAPTVLSLPDVVHRFKTLSTKRYVDGVKQHNWKSFDKKLWKRNYYEHIVRGETELNKIHGYIINNPLNWQTDDENPDR